MWNFIQSLGAGGIFIALGIAFALFNISMSAIAQAFIVLGKQEPQWMQTAAAWGLKITQWLSANTPTPPAAPPKA